MAGADEPSWYQPEKKAEISRGWGQSQGNPCEEEPGPWHMALELHSLLTFGCVSYDIFFGNLSLGFSVTCSKSHPNGLKAAIKGKALKSDKLGSTI